MKITATFLLIAILIVSCAEYKETSHFSIDDSNCSVEVTDSTLQLTYVVGCLGGRYRLHHFSRLNDSTLVFSDGKPERNNRGVISFSDFCLIDNDTVYHFRNSVRLSISGRYETYELCWVEKEKIKKKR